MRDECVHVLTRFDRLSLVAAESVAWLGGLDGRRDVFVQRCFLILVPLSLLDRNGMVQLDRRQCVGLTPRFMVESFWHRQTLQVFEMIQEEAFVAELYRA